ncbi:MAG: hypothetical protein AB7G75_11495 [Candidatus Binatia bacterium]
MRIWGKLRQEFAHAFALNSTGEQLNVEDIALLGKIATFIVKRGMETPALLFLESVAPLGFLGSQVMHGLKPFLDLVCHPLELERLAKILEQRDGLDRLILLIQEHANRPA